LPGDAAPLLVWNMRLLNFKEFLLEMYHAKQDFPHNHLKAYSSNMPRCVRYRTRSFTARGFDKLLKRCVVNGKFVEPEKLDPILRNTLIELDRVTLPKRKKSPHRPPPDKKRVEKAKYTT